jgi:hypothetical protein
VNPDRAIALVLAVSLAVVLALGAVLLHRAHQDAAAPAPAPTVAATAALAIAPTATVAIAAVPAAARGYRLAGTVVGDLSYAIIENPSGANQLYRPGQSVPGLGELTGVESDRVTLAGRDGSFALQLAPAATATTTATPRPTPPSGTPSAFAATPSARRPLRDQSPSESSP